MQTSEPRTTARRCNDGEHSPANPRIVSHVDGTGFETEADCQECGATLFGYHDASGMSVINE